jgi:uncharacterized damage-inducible protein DinB
MSIRDEMLMEFREELCATRKILDRVPADKLAWRPHEKSMSLGQLALHIATVPAGIVRITTPDSFDVLKSNFAPPLPKSTAEIHAALEQTARSVEDALTKDERRIRAGAVALDARRSRAPGDAPVQDLAVAHVEPLVSPSWPAHGLSATARYCGSCDLRSERRRIPVCVNTVPPRKRPAT